MMIKVSPFPQNILIARKTPASTPERPISVTNKQEGISVYDQLIPFEGTFLSRLTGKADTPYEQFFLDLKRHKLAKLGIEAGSEEFYKSFVTEKNLDTVKAILAQNEVITDIAGRKYFRFSQEDIKDITLATHKNNAAYLKPLLESKAINHETRYPFRFRAEEITQILKLMTPEKEPTFKTLLEAKNADPQYAEKLPEYRFLGYGIANTIGALTPVNTPYLNKLLALQDPLQQKPAVDDYNIAYFLEGITEASKPFLESVLTNNAIEPRDKQFCLANINPDNTLIAANILKNPLIDGFTKGIILKSTKDKDLAQINTLLSPSNKANSPLNYTPKEIQTYVKLIRFDLFEQLDTFKTYIKEDRLTLEDLSEMLTSLPKYAADIYMPVTYENAQSIPRLLAYKDENTDNYRFTAEDIKGIIPYVEANNDQLLDYLLERKPQEIQTAPFEGREISHYLENLTNNHLDDFRYVCEYKDNQGNCKFDNAQIRALSNFVMLKAPIQKVVQEKKLEDYNENDLLGLLRFYRVNKNDMYPFYQMTSNPVIETDKKAIKNIIGDISTRILKANTSRIKNTTFNSTYTLLKNGITSIDKSLQDFDLNNFLEKNTCLPLQYSLEQLNKDIEGICTPLTPVNKELIEELFSFTRSNNRIEGFPYIKNDLSTQYKEALPKSDDPKQLKQATLALRKCLQAFYVDNTITNIGSNALATDLNNIFHAMPELFMTVGRTQHKTHKFTLDGHLLKTVQGIINNTDYQSNLLTEKDRQNLKLAAIIHDISKKEDTIDPFHPMDSARLAYQILKRLAMPNNDIEQICGLIRNHEWVKNLEESKGEKDKQTRLENTAIEFRRPKDLLMAKILATSDLEAIGNEHFSDRMKDNDKAYINDLKELINQIHNRGIILPQTKIPKASEINLKPRRIMDTETAKTTLNTVIEINKRTNLEEIGFKKGTTPDNFAVLTHMITKDNKALARDIDFAAMEGNEGVFCTSYVTPNNFMPLGNREYGFVFDVDQNNIGIATNYDIGSGREQTIDKFKDYLLADKKLVHTDPLYQTRIEFSEALKEELQSLLHIPPEDYGNLFQQFQNKQDIGDIEKENPLLAKAINNVVNSHILSNLNNGHGLKNNEVIVYAPKPTAIISKLPAEKIQYELKKYAQDNDLPILIIKS